MFESHYYYFVGATFLILYFVVRSFENFHQGRPEPGSIYDTSDEPIANRFIFAYGLALVPYVFFVFISVILAAYLFIYGIQAIILAITLYFDGEAFIIKPLVIDGIIKFFAPWQVQGYSAYEIIGFGLAGYKMGLYSEEKGGKTYINSILVYLVYFSIFIWGIVGLEGNPTYSVYFLMNYQSEEILLFLFFDLVTLMLMTWYGNSKSIALDKGDDVSILPSVSGKMRIIYIGTLLGTIVFFMVSAVFTGILRSFGVSNIGYIPIAIDEFIMFSSFYMIIFVIFIYAAISIIRGDISRIVIILDENDNVINDDEDQEQGSPKVFSLLTAILGLVSLFSLYYLPVI